MRLSQVKEFETRLTEMKNVFGEDSKAYARAYQEYNETISAWEATPDEVKIIDWFAPVVEPEPEKLKDDTLYFNSKDGLKEVETLPVQPNEPYLFKYPETDERFMAVTFKD